MSTNESVPAVPDANDPPPQRPPEPAAADCCGDGCVRCVYDVHDEAIERYKSALAAWQARHPSSEGGRQACG